MGQQVRIFLLGLLALVATGACGGNSTPKATEATVPSVAPSTTPADPYAVPPTIDAAYLNRVFAALEHVDGDATRLIVAGGTLVPEAAKRLRAIYAEDEFQEQVNLWLDLVIKKELPRSRANPGDIAVDVKRLLTAGPECIYVAVERDYSAVVAASSSPETSYVALRPLDRARDPFSLNPTPWMVAFDGYHTDGTAPKNPCAS